MFVEMIRSFQERWPKVRIRLELTDRVVDPVDERIDVAFRAHLGPLPDSQLVARRLLTIAGGVFASSAWVAAHPAIRHPSELRALSCVAHARTGGTTWVLQAPPEEVRVEVEPVLVANDLAFIRAAVLAGVGVAVLPMLFVGPGLVRLVPEWSTPAGTLSLVWVGGRAPSPRLRRFVEHVTGALGGCTTHGGSPAPR